jgi:hypothetical protein
MRELDISLLNFRKWPSTLLVMDKDLLLVILMLRLFIIALIAIYPVLLIHVAPPRDIQAGSSVPVQSAEKRKPEPHARRLLNGYMN